MEAKKAETTEVSSRVAQLEEEMKAAAAQHQETLSSQKWVVLSSRLMIDMIALFPCSKESCHYSFYHHPIPRADYEAKLTCLEATRVALEGERDGLEAKLKQANSEVCVHPCIL